MPCAATTPSDRAAALLRRARWRNCARVSRGRQSRSAPASGSSAMEADPRFGRSVADRDRGGRLGGDRPDPADGHPRREHRRRRRQPRPARGAGRRGRPADRARPPARTPSSVRSRRLRPDELIQDVRLPLPAPAGPARRTRSSWSRGLWEYACVNVAAAVGSTTAGKVLRLALAVGSVTGGPVSVDLADLRGGRSTARPRRGRPARRGRHPPVRRRAGLRGVQVPHDRRVHPAGHDQQRRAAPQKEPTDDRHRRAWARPPHATASRCRSPDIPPRRAPRGSPSCTASRSTARCGPA